MPLYPPAIQTVTDPWSTHDCRLDWVSTSTVRLSRWGGQWLMINGVRCVLPATLDFNISAYHGSYYVYAMRTGNAVTALGVATGSYANDAYGMPCVNGDPEKTLVGLMFAASGSMANQAYVCSYWNRRQRVTAGSVSNVQSTSTSLVPIGSGLVFAQFANEPYEGMASGTAWGLNVDALLVYTCMTLDGGPLGQSNIICPRYNGWYCPVGQKAAFQSPASDSARTFGISGSINTNGGGAYVGQWLLQYGVKWLG